MHAMRNRYSLPRRRRSDRGYALVSALVFLLVMLVLGSSMLEWSTNELYLAGRAKKDARAFNLAEAGIEYAAWQLQNGHSYPAQWVRGDFESGSFLVSAEPHPDGGNKVILLSTGTSQGWTAQVKVVGRFLPADGSADIFDNALTSDSDIWIKGNVEINGNAHANGHILQEGDYLIDGDITAGGSITFQGNGSVSGSTQTGADSQTLPAVDLEYFRSNASQIYNGDTFLNDNITLDGILFVDGDLSINGNIDGSGSIVASGDIFINDNIMLNDPTQNEFALVSAKSIYVDGNYTIYGFIYAHSISSSAPAEFNSNITLYGGIAADYIYINGNVWIEHHRPNVPLPGGGLEPQFHGVSWRRMR